MKWQGLVYNEFVKNIKTALLDGFWYDESVHMEKIKAVRGLKTISNSFGMLPWHAGE